jgi:NAD(P)H-hydrate repair Nnr-like enzyme with NAD(P)H-hydrate dehydratase domain
LARAWAAGWGKQALQKVENFRKPMLWDADALNLLAINPISVTIAF